uniref:(California timema) hypothetical protein n=1 Tax=Timema californicum TaxID=61474 RepID=A0A7R9J5T3_TIMCA|nr:unnamed protein product [Timema californicum]
MFLSFAGVSVSIPPDSWLTATYIFDVIGQLSGERYTCAVLLGHVEPGFPYISDTGALPPESCVFAQLLGIASVLLACCVYIKYRQVCERLKINQESKLIKPRTNLIVAWLGAASCLGISMVGNFQVSNEKLIHAAGAGMCFICGTVYFCMQEKLLSVHPTGIEPRLTAISNPIYCKSSALGHQEGENNRKWRPEDGGWDAHIVSTVSEWMLSIIFCTFILTYVRDFSYIHLEPPVVRLEIPP